ncbi:TetR family transcriptional regulator [Streptomyces sp. NPDC127084]|uniref:TetR/AcrR family transcriptional regulator n=1 Tax=Streptomyces sp. NPDC127084 TaxID=3347133 RepID=UPI003656F109
MNKSRGRPPGRSDTRARILAAARESFLRHGYNATTMRAVAESVDVDPALISYYYGTKQGLFGSAMSLGIAPGQVIDRVLRSEPERLPQAILQAVLTVWDNPDIGRPLTLLVTQAQRDPALQRTFGEYVQRELIGRLAAHIGGRDATERASGMLTVTLGMIMSRYVLKLHPLASMEPQRVQQLLTPSLTAALHQPGTPRTRGR